MNERGTNPPPEQEAIRAKCFHPSGTFVEFPKEEIEQSIPDRFEKIVRMYPNNLAFKIADEVATYAEINALANRFARALLDKLGRGSEPIGLLLENGVELLAATFGSLKAGKFVVGVDPNFPRERAKAIIDDSQARLIVTHTTNVTPARELSENATILAVGSISRGTSAENLNLSIPATAHAFLVYTSGSTGAPKGVLHDHRSRLYGIMERANGFHLSQNDRVSLLSSGTANSIGNSLRALLNGASLHAFNVNKNGIAVLAKWLLEEKITVCSMSASLFREFCKILTGQESFRDLRILGLRSETVLKTDFELYKKYFPPSCFLVNGLSVSEAGLLTMHFLDHQTDVRGNEVPVGYTVKDKEVLLIDDYGNKVGFNRLGEIVVRSKYLFPGYWSNPDLTGVKFKPDPENPEKRIYYTGDLGLMLPDGCLIHKGRKDFRVKIHGYGVDLTEVEKTLLSCRGLKEAAVVCRNDNSETRLVAYCTPQAEPSPTVSELRRHLRNKLPDYMIPSIFVKLQAMPLTPNGKIDRRALPDPGNERPNLDTAFVAPVSPIEEKLTQMWSEILSLDQVGIHDNFFDLGGHSLAGARLVSLIHEEFKFDLPVSEFFAEPTIAQLTQRIEAAREVKPGVGKKAWTYLCELQRGKDRKPVFVFPGGGGGEPEFFVYGFLARHVGTEYPFYGLRSRGANGVLQPHTSVAQMADAYVEEIRAMQPEGPYFLVGECAGGVNAYEAARQLQAQGQEVALLVLMDVERPTLIKYLRFHASRWLEPVSELWNENYYLARIPHHLKQLRSLDLGQYPSYFLGRVRSTLKPAEKKPRPIDSRHERAAIVLYSTASGDALHHIEWVRENYRRAVRRFRPEHYNGHIDILASEKLYRHDPTLGWKKLALKGLSIHPLPGDHWTYIREHVAVAGPKLRECLERAEENRRSCSS